MIDLIRGDLFTVVPQLAPASVDAIVTDPPYGLGFMGRSWDTFSPARARASKASAVGHGDKGRPWAVNPNLKGRKQSPAMSPSQIEYDRTLAGQHQFEAWTESWARLAFEALKPGGHILVCGAPRSHHRMICGLEDAGFEIRDCLAWLFGQGFPKSKDMGAGWGTALKPGHEPIVVARKPGKSRELRGLNIDACRLGAAPIAYDRRRLAKYSGDQTNDHQLGRWPSNVLLDEDAAARLDAQTGELWSGFMRAGQRRKGIGYSGGLGKVVRHDTIGDAGGASRFFYVAKASRAERDFGCERMARTSGGAATHRKAGSKGLQNPRAGAGRTGGARNIHPTVKPLALMRWLVRLVTPPGGRVADFFMGSGTTGMACVLEGFDFYGCERDAKYFDIAKRRIAAVRRRMAA